MFSKLFVHALLKTDRSVNTGNKRLRTALTEGNQPETSTNLEKGNSPNYATQFSAFFMLIVK
jgi:hypothetical protein